MLRLKEVTKKYVSKRGNECDALRGVSFDLPEKGLYFILGKSGSGKSTLLNLLGGLDKCTGGEIILNGLNISKMQPAQLDVYRNEYLGFIFQEFNLIDNLSIGENVSLPLSLQGIKEEGQVEKALEDVGLSGMSARFPEELSGGQKQRVAIARALIKNPQIILADEPTGNLDSQTGKDIFELLVSLSKSKLIIVVSHDRESAQKYGDGIIELKDGKVINNTCPASEEVKEESADLKKFRTKLPDRVAFRMGFSNLLKKKVRSISCILIAILTIASIALMQMILSYSPEFAISDQVQKDGNSHVVLLQYGGYIPQSTEEYIRDAWGAKYVRSNGLTIYLESEEELLAAGYEFVGEHLPLNENSVYISEDYFKQLLGKRLSERPYVYEDGEFVVLNRDRHNIDNLVGKMISFGLPDTNRAKIIAGFVGTVEDKYTPDNNDLFKAEMAWNDTVNGTTFILLDKGYDSTYKYLIVDLSSINDLYGFLMDVRGLDVSAYVVNSDFYYGFEISANQFGWQFCVIACILAALLLLFVINLISVSIKNQQKEIGILRALGARSRDIFKIYIFECLFLAVVPSIVCTGGIFLLAWLINKAFTAGHFVYISLIFVDWLTVLITVAASFVLIGLATVIPLNKIVKMRPIDAIRNL